MDNTGMFRKLDVLGRIVIPAEIRRSLELKEGDSLAITLDEGRIILSRTTDSCVLCGARSNLRRPQPDGKAICSSCADAAFSAPVDLTTVPVTDFPRV